MSGLVPAWRPRHEPLAPVAALARGAAAIALVRRLDTVDDAALAALAGVAGPGVIALVARGGAGAALPWVDGIVYLGVDEGAPRLRLPTALAPDVPPALLEAALARGGAAAPIAVVPGLVVSLAGARPLARARLAAWLEAAR